MGTRVTGAELEIMQFLWKHPETTFAELLEWSHQCEKHEWSKQTLNTYLLRLAKRGLVCREKKEGSRSIYRPGMTEIRYQQACAEEILEESYGGGLANFIAALSGRARISKAEEQELMELIHKTSDTTTE